MLWSPQETAEQLCLIEGALFQRVGNDEILRYFTTKGEAKAKASPNLTAIFEHFNRVSCFQSIQPKLPSSQTHSIRADVSVLHVEHAHPTLLC